MIVFIYSLALVVCQFLPFESTIKHGKVKKPSLKKRKGYAVRKTGRRNYRCRTGRKRNKIEAAGITSARILARSHATFRRPRANVPAGAKIVSANPLM
jgi:hypothetical protein